MSTGGEESDPGDSGSEDAPRPLADPLPPESLLRLLREQRERIRPVETDGLRRDLILYLAEDRLRRRVERNPPANPRAWLRRVVDNLMKSKEIPRRREQQVEDLESVAAGPECIHAATEEEIEQEEARVVDWRDNFASRLEWVLRNLPVLLPDDVPRSVVLARLEHRGTRAAARALGMDNRTFVRTENRAIRQILLALPENYMESLPDTLQPPPS